MNFIEVSNISNALFMGSNTIATDENKTSTFESKLNNAISNKDDKELKKACEEFESYFIQTMYKAMRKTVNSSDGFIKKSQGEEIFQDMLDEENSKSAAMHGGIGLATMMYKQMSREKESIVSV